MKFLWNSLGKAWIIVEHKNYGKRTTGINRKPCNSFFIVSMGSGTDHGLMSPTTTKNNKNIVQHGSHTPSTDTSTKACSLGWKRTALMLDIHYGQLTPVKTRYLLTNTMWPYCRLRFRDHWCHVLIFKLCTERVLGFRLDGRLKSG